MRQGFVFRAAPGFHQYQMEVHSKVMNIENISIDLQSTIEETVKDALIALNALHIIEVAKVSYRLWPYSLFDK